MRTLLFLVAFLFSSATFAAPVEPRPAPTLDLDMVPLSQVVRVIYKEAMTLKSYVIGPEMLNDQRLVSFRHSPKDGNFLVFFHSFLKSLGYLVQSQGNVDFIIPTPAAASLSPIEDPALDIFFYRPKFRDGAYLVEMLSSLFRGKFTLQRVIASPEGGRVPAFECSSPSRVCSREYPARRRSAFIQRLQEGNRSPAKVACPGGC